MEDKEIIDYIQREADNELFQMETFPENIRKQIKEECDRLRTEIREWVKAKEEEQC